MMSRLPSIIAGFGPARPIDFPTNGAQTMFTRVVGRL